MDKAFILLPFLCKTKSTAMIYSGLNLNQDKATKPQTTPAVYG